jgi:hypothetical protein
VQPAGWSEGIETYKGRGQNTHYGFATHLLTIFSNVLLLIPTFVTTPKKSTIGETTFLSMKVSVALTKNISLDWSNVQ